MDFTYTESEIEWNYNNESKIYNVENIEFASYEKKGIYIEICNDTGYEYRYLDLNGKDIVWFTSQGILSIFGAKEKATIQFKEIDDVTIIDENIFVIVSEGKEKKIMEYLRTGKLKRQYKSPLHYTFYRFTEFKNELAVICQEYNSTDKYGRRDWKFVYNKISEDWEKKSLVY